jgi:hypothetical protein
VGAASLELCRRVIVVRRKWSRLSRTSAKFANGLAGFVKKICYQLVMKGVRAETVCSRYLGGGVLGVWMKLTLMPA